MLLSVREIGVIQPIIVWKKDRSYIPVTGFRRLEAAEKLQLSEVPALELEENYTPLEAFRMAFYDNLGSRLLSLAEKALAVRKFTEFGLEETEIIRKVLSRLGVPPSGRTLRILLDLAAEENLLPAVHEKNWKLAAVEKFLFFSEEEKSLLLRLVAGVSLNRQTELIDGFYALKKRTGRSLPEMFEEPKFQAVLGRLETDRVQTAEKMAEILKEKLSPLVSEITREIEKEIRALSLPPQVRVEYDRTLEEPGLRLQAELSSAEELKDLLGELGTAERERHWSNLFKIMNRAED